MGLERLVEQCARMERHLEGTGHTGRLWARQSHAMIEQARAHPSAGLFSSRVFLMRSFGGGFEQPDESLLRGPVALRALRRYRRLVRGTLGYGRLGDFALGPLAWEEIVERALEASRSTYRNATMAGYQLLRRGIEDFDVRSGNVLLEQCVDVEGRPLAWLTLVSLKRVLALREQVGTVGTMVEIGSGTGEFARLMLTTGTARRCVLVDIPPALAFAQEVLSDHFLPHELSMFEPGRTRLDWEGTVRCTFLTPDQIRYVDTADLIVNVASFGEMTRTLVRGYAAECKRMGAPHVVSINAVTPHPLAASERIDSQFLRDAFHPEYRVVASYEWTKSVEIEWRPTPSGAAYEWLQFALIDGGAPGMRADPRRQS